MPRDTQRTAALLESLLSGGDLSPDELDDLLRCKVDEDLHLEYKHGDELKKPGQEPHRTIRQYVSGFANGAGGVLLIGVDEDKWQVTGCTPPKGGDVVRWASSCVSPISGFLSPRPRFGTVDYPDGRQVLVVATARSPVLVPCYEAPQRPVYYLRMDDKTLVADEYLVADLVLGRREHAYLGLTWVETFGSGKNTGSEGHREWWFHLQFTIENQGLARAENVRLGIVNRSARHVSEFTPVSDHLRRHVEVVDPDPDKYKGEVAEFRQHITACVALEPFAFEKLSTAGRVSVPLSWSGQFYTPYEWKAAVYVTAENTPPAWYQLIIKVDQPLIEYVASNQELTSDGPFLRVERVAAGRPVVGWIGEKI